MLCFENVGVIMKYIITGASSGIGKRCAERLLEQGHECVLIARNEERLAKLCNSYDLAHAVPIDLSQVSSIESAFIKIKKLFPFDGMVHCAGIAPLSRTDENDMDIVRTAYATNVFSFIELMRLFVGNGACKDGASVVIMSSVVAQRGSNRQSIYSGTKAALDATARCMARELVNRRIRINTITSGTVETEMLQQLREKNPNLDEKIKAHSPLGIVPIDEVCSMIEYLLSDKSSHITGASMPLDAGYLL